MQTGMLHLHSILRWVILILLLLTIYHAFAKKEAIKKSSLFLLIAAHIMFVIGVYQVGWGTYGYTKPLPPGANIMDDQFRFYMIEHPLLMVISIGLITVARRKAQALNYKATKWMLLIALLLILAAIPWPFRTGGIGRPWFPGM
jgi:hypothetical protein